MNELEKILLLKSEVPSQSPEFLGIYLGFFVKDLSRVFKQSLHNEVRLCLAQEN